MGHLSILLEAVNIVPFLPFSILCLLTTIDSFIKNYIFNMYALKISSWFSLHHHPNPQQFLHPVEKSFPAIVNSLHLDENQSMHRLKS